MLRGSLLCGLTLEFDARSRPPPASPAARALLAWLAQNPGRHSQRDLTAQLWPALGDAEAGAALRTAVSELPGALADDEAGWADDEREAHRERLLSMLEGLAQQAEEAGDLHAAARWTHEQTMLDPLSEQRHRALIVRLYAVGDRAGAIAAYERLRERLRSDLRIKPSAETRALVERLGRG